MSCLPTHSPCGIALTSLSLLIPLFLSALVSATLFPGQSEAVLAAMLMKSSASWIVLVAVASAGNILGSVINWLLGRGIERFRGRRWFPVREVQLTRAQSWYRRFGKWSLLLSWAPVIGDPLTLVAGVLREPFPVFLALVSCAKIARYLVMAFVALQWVG